MKHNVTIYPSNVYGKNHKAYALLQNLNSSNGVFYYDKNYYRIIAFAPPKIGELYINTFENDHIDLVVENKELENYGNVFKQLDPRFIVEKVKENPKIIYWE